jgi:hypothetical protein
MRTNILTILFCAALGCALPAHAGLIWDQTPVNGNALDFTNYRVADDFTVSTFSTISAVNFWYFAQDQTDLSNVTYGIYQNSAGALGSLLYSGTVAPNTSPDNASVYGDFIATISLPSLTLSAGSYWLELHAGTSFTDPTDNGGLTVQWATVNDNATGEALTNPGDGSLPGTPVNVSEFEQTAFQLNGSAVPEPSGGLLAASGLVLLLAASRRSVRLRKTRAFRIAAAIRSRML